jgi:hypothetical protein
MRGDKSSKHVTVSSIDTNSQLGNIEFFKVDAAGALAAARSWLESPNILAFLGLFHEFGLPAGETFGDQLYCPAPSKEPWTFFILREFCDCIAAA